MVKARRAVGPASSGPPGKLMGPVTVTPTPLRFLADDPDTGTVAATTPVQVRWYGVGDHSSSWTLTVQAMGSRFENCPALPVSAVQATCQSVDPGHGEGACAPNFPISTAPQKVASGIEAQGNREYIISITFTLSDSWRYIAATNPQCTLSLLYTVDFP